LEDNCPIAVLESMAAGVPVAASKVGGVPDLISDGEDGLLFEPRQPESLRSAVARLLDIGGEGTRISRSARAKALRCYHPKAIAGRHIEIYREVLATKSRRV